MKKISLYLDRLDAPPGDLSTKLHGFLMEQLDSSYVDWLHEQATNPYAMKVRHQEDLTIWTIHLLTEDCQRQVLPILLELTGVNLVKLGTVGIRQTLLEDLTADNLLKIFYGSNSPSVFTLYFETPTGFRSQGEYVFFPSERLIFQSLMQKYNRLMEGTEYLDQELLEHLVEQTRISSYRLESSYFKVHGKRIPAFRGRITLRVRGADTLKAYVYMLLRFGTYAGIGMKTSLGMGGIRLETRED